ncbi:hypothetical protein NN484_08325 [Pseudomonas serboccidentalis]|uniref:Uncharacterized protein n=1 Tax=Pseudomonas serboccidentalis TaxID=2964670 RepID=A0ABY7ZDD3_9PSED|nr:hypothetical protein [Pseudomonas serboccidentalis]WDR37729.1 hypothetical protein NN484_08325 [Pseudomonas serboccidentalis]
MTTDYGQRVCNRCGDLITAYCPSIESLAIIGAFHEKGDQAVVDEIVRRENIDPNVVWEYFRHRMRPLCEQKLPGAHSAEGS